VNILFICTGNTCRSPMAQALLEKMAEEKGLDIRVTSAGIFALDGEEASHNAIEVLKAEGIDLSNHRARLLHRDLVEEADLILTMSKSHKDAILSKYHFLEGKVFTLKEYAYGKEEDIADPFGGDLESYKRTKEEIKEALRQLTIDNGQF